jgi:hypothetical protein
MYDIEMHDDLELKGIGATRAYRLLGRRQQRIVDIESLPEAATTL